jgi:PAS domain S-box-containing protein
MRPNTLLIREASGSYPQARAERGNEELLRLQALYRDLFEATREAHLVTDGDGVVRDANTAARELFGAASDGAVVGKRLGVLVASGHAWRIRSALQELQADGGDADFLEVHVRCGRGPKARLVCFRVHRIPHAGARHLLRWSAHADGPPNGAFEQARFERLAGDLARSYDDSARELRARDHFLATLAHELRTPLSAIVGYARMLRTRKLGPEGHARALATIEQSALAQGRLISDMMEAARIGEGKLAIQREGLDLAALVEGEVFASRPAAEARGVVVGLEVGSGPHLVEADAARLAQAVSNLLSNAIKFTPRGGLVTVSVVVGERDAVVRVADTGEGIADHALLHLFERFWQADDPHARARGGLGLGLSIVRDVVELHGGTVRAESPGPGCGATFVMTIPVRSAPRHLGFPESLGGMGSAAPARG